MVDDIFDVEVDTTGDDVLLRLSGELDLYTAPRLRGPVSDAVASGRDVVIDLAALTFIDSTGIADIARLHRRLAAIGRRLRVRSPQPNVYRVLEISGLVGPIAVD